MTRKYSSAFLLSRLSDWRNIARCRSRFVSKFN